MFSKFSSYKVVNSNLRSSFRYKPCQRELLREEIYIKNLVFSKLEKESKFLYNNANSNFNVIGCHHVLNILLISNETELEQTKFRHLSKVKTLSPSLLEIL